MPSKEHTCSYCGSDWHPTDWCIWREPPTKQPSHIPGLGDWKIASARFSTDGKNWTSLPVPSDTPDADRLIRQALEGTEYD